MKYQCKTCDTAGEENFYKSVKYFCKSCWNKRMAKEGKEKSDLLKMENGGQCVRCGYNRCLDALEFHHTDPNLKEFSLGQRRGLKIETLRKELEKCILVCSNCHTEIHAGLK